MMIFFWIAGFARLERVEILLLVSTNVIFVLMDIATLRQGSFRFTKPDVLGLPYYEFLMWGFYVLNTIRFLDGTSPVPRPTGLVIGLVLLFALPFSLIQDYRLLFLASGFVMAIGIGFFHEGPDIAAIGYMISMGAIIEYAGVLSGQWHYDGPTLRGVPLWFTTMWGGVGLFARRLALPLIGLRRPAR
jgi:hypothetical protein